MGSPRVFCYIPCCTCTQCKTMAGNHELYPLIYMYSNSILTIVKCDGEGLVIISKSGSNWILARNTISKFCEVSTLMQLQYHCVWRSVSVLGSVGNPGLYKGKLLLLQTHKTVPICGGQRAHNCARNTMVLPAELCNHWPPPVDVVSSACSNCNLTLNPKS